MRKVRMRNLGALVVSAFFVAMPLSASAQEIQCNSTYTTVRGDSLSRISQRAYGSPSAYQRIFSVNPGKLRSVNVVPIGIDLFIPCADDGNSNGGSNGRLTQLANANSDNIKFLTGADYAPYVGDGLPNGGFSTELIERAMQYNGQPADYKIDVIRDWGAHLSPLLSNGAYDLGYPWFRPNCSQYDSLGESSRWRCDNLLFSDPLHEIVVTAYGPASAPDLSSAQDARGLTICRPTGFFTHDLEAFGLEEGSYTREAPSTARDCFELLRDGKVDIVSVNADTSEKAISDLGLQNQVKELYALSSVQTLRVVGMKSNPRTRLLLLRLNQGLRGLNNDGSFLRIAAKHL